MPYYQNQTTGQVQWFDTAPPPGWGPVTPGGAAGNVGHAIGEALDPRPRVAGVTDAIGGQFGYGNSGQPPSAPRPMDPRDYPGYQGPPRQQAPPAPAAPPVRANVAPTAPKPGEGDYVNKLQTYLSDEIDYRHNRIADLQAQYDSYGTEEGQKKFVDEYTAAYKQMNDQITAAGGVVQPLQPEALEAALVRRMNSIRQSITADDQAQKAAQNSLTSLATKQSPAVLAQANINLAKSLEQARNLEYEQQQRESNPFGLTVKEQLAYEMQQNQLGLNQLDKGITLDQYMSADQLKREYEIPRQMLIDRVNVASKLMDQEDQRSAAKLTNDRSVWETLNNGALTQWSTQYNNDVKQREQDVTAANDMAGRASEMARAMMPFVVPRAYNEAALGAGSPYAKMGGTPVDFSKVPGVPGYNELMNAPQAQWEKMMGTPGLPGRIEAPPFQAAPPPDPSTYFGGPSAAESYLQSFYGSPSPNPSIPNGDPYAWSAAQRAQMSLGTHVGTTPGGYNPSQSLAFQPPPFTPDMLAYIDQQNQGPSVAGPEGEE